MKIENIKKLLEQKKFILKVNILHILDLKNRMN